MHPVRLLEKWLERNTLFIHKSRAASLVSGVGGLVRGGKLTLSHLGRALAGTVRTKHKIKRMDRLLGNARLHRERPDIYRALAHWLLAGVERPVILVDWSDCEPGHEWLMLTAALSVKGRAIPIYEEVHRLSAYNSPKTHGAFLAALREVVPGRCKPIVVSDAGFRGPWFRAVEAQGWDWVGRIRNGIKIREDGGTRWRTLSAIYREATSKVRHLGWCWLSHKQPYGANLYLVKASQRGPGRPPKAHGMGTAAKRCRKMYRDPWLLATSMKHEKGMGTRVVKLYAKRMQIEESFRDLKDDRWGFGLALARSHSVQRRQVLLLIATLAVLQLWLVGLAAKAKGWSRHFQANTERRREVLSVIFLAREVLRHPGYTLSGETIGAAFDALRRQLQQQAVPA